MVKLKCEMLLISVVYKAVIVSSMCLDCLIFPKYDLIVLVILQMISGTENTRMSIYLTNDQQNLKYCDSTNYSSKIE